MNAHAAAPHHAPGASSALLVHGVPAVHSVHAAAPPVPADPVEAETLRVGNQLFDLADFHQPAAWSPTALQERAMQTFIGDEAVKVSALRFVDVFPAIADDDTIVADHIAEYFGPMLEEAQYRSRSNPRLLQFFRLVAAMAKGPTWMKGLLGLGSRTAIRTMARQFIGGATLPLVAKCLRSMERGGLAFSLDLLGEAVISRPEAEDFLRRYHAVLDSLEELMGPAWERDPVTGPRVNISIKLTALVDHFDPIDPDMTSAQVRRKLRPLLRKARRRGAFINVDMEKFAYRDLTFRIVGDIMMEDEFRDWEDIGIVHQAYLRDADTCLARWLEFLDARGHGMTIRIVKGAYWDSEQIWSNQKSWPVPVITQKTATDAMYEQCLRMLLDRHDRVRTAIASHNIRSIAHALAYAEHAHVPRERLEVQMLYGMAAPTRRAVRDLGVPVRVYTPCGELISGIAYLVRRLLENTSQDSFLMQRGTATRSREQLLARPA